MLAPLERATIVWISMTKVTKSLIAVAFLVVLFLFLSTLMGSPGYALLGIFVAVVISFIVALFNL